MRTAAWRSPSPQKSGLVSGKASTRERVAHCLLRKRASVACGGKFLGDVCVAQFLEVLTRVNNP